MLLDLGYSVGARVGPGLVLIVETVGHQTVVERISKAQLNLIPLKAQPAA